MNSREPVRVLVVEDESVSRRALGRVLQSRGYKVRLAESAERAIEILRGDDLPDVVLLDVDLPGMHGDEFFTRLQRIAPEVVTILVTAEEPQTLQSLTDEGVSLVRKPVNPQELLSILHDSIDRDVGGQTTG